MPPCVYIARFLPFYSPCLSGLYQFIHVHYSVETSNNEFGFNNVYNMNYYVTILLYYYVTIQFVCNTFSWLSIVVMHYAFMVMVYGSNLLCTCQTHICCAISLVACFTQSPNLSSDSLIRDGSTWLVMPCASYKVPTFVFNFLQFTKEAFLD